MRGQVARVCPGCLQIPHLRTVLLPLSGLLCLLLPLELALLRRDCAMVRSGAEPPPPPPLPPSSAHPLKPQPPSPWLRGHE